MQHHYSKPMIYLHWTLAMLACIVYRSRGKRIDGYILHYMLVKIKYRYAIPQYTNGK